MFDQSLYLGWVEGGGGLVNLSSPCLSFLPHVIAQLKINTLLLNLGNYSSYKVDPPKKYQDPYFTPWERAGYYRVTL
jgi:hypothetical protein